MLILSRKKNETIVIGDDVWITVVDIRKDRVRIGIDAQKGISVHRLEIYEAIQREGRQFHKPQEQSNGKEDQ